MQRLVVYQSLWAMEQRRPDGVEWSLDEKLQMIRDAGFDGAGVRFFDRDYARQVTRAPARMGPHLAGAVLSADGRGPRPDPRARVRNSAPTT